MGIVVELEKQPSAGQKYLFGPFKLIPGERTLLRGEEPVPLASKSFDLLLLLVESAGHLKTRDVLMAALWPDTVVEEANLSWNMRVLRKVLGDEGDTPRYIQTVRGHGYRFIMPVSLDSPAVPDAYRTKRPLVHRYMPWAVIFAVVIAIAMVITLSLLHPQTTRNQGLASLRPAVAILGFQNLSSDRKADWIGTALTEMISTDLAVGGAIRTTPSLDVTRVRREFNIPAGSVILDHRILNALRENLSTNYVANGAYLMLGQGKNAQLRVDVKLINTSNGKIIAALSETGSQDKLFDLVRALGVALRQDLGAAALSPSEESEVRATIPASPAAAQLYSEGSQALNSGNPVVARKLLERAVDVEPDFPLAYVSLAQVWMELGDEVNASAVARMALNHSAGLARPQRLLIDGLYRESVHQWDQAVEDYRALFTFFPDELQYGLLLARAQVKADKPKDALRTVQTLRKLPPPAGDDPRVGIAEVNAYDTLGNNQRAAEAAVQAVITAKARGAALLEAEALSHLGRSENLLGNYADALKNLGKARELYEKTGGDALGLGITLERIGNVYNDQGSYDTAIRIYGIANEAFARVGNGYWQGAALNNIGNVYYHRNQLSQAKHYYQLALPMFRDIHRELATSIVLNNLGVIEGNQGNVINAIKDYQEVLTIRHAAGLEAQYPDTLFDLGDTYVDIGEFQQARQYLQKAMAIYKKNDDLSDEANVISALADIDMYEDRLLVARHGYEKALAIRKTKGMHNDTAESERDLAELALLTGKPQNAVMLAKSSVAGYQKEKAGTDEARSRAVLGLALVAEGRNADARAQLKAIKALYPAIEPGFLRLNLDIFIARLNAGLGNTANATNALQQTIARAANLGLSTTEYQARLALAQVQAKQGVTPQLRKSIVQLESDARKAGCLLVARQARELLSNS